MLASCFKKQMQLEFMFSSLSEKRNQSKLPSKSCAVIQIPPPKSATGSRSQGMEEQKFTRQLWHRWHEADSSGAQLSDWRPLLCSPLSLRTVIIITCRRVRNEALVVDNRNLLERVGRRGIFDSATSSGNPSPAGWIPVWLWIVSWLACQWGKHKVNAKQQGSFIF